MSFRPSTALSPVIYGADPASYHALGNEFKAGDPRRVMSRSQLQRFSKCPSKWIRSAESDDETSAMEFGSLVDTCVTMPERFESIYALAPEQYPTTGMECPVCKTVTDSAKCAKCKVPRVEVSVLKDWNWASTTCQDWREEQQKLGKTVVKSTTASEAWKAAARLREDEEIGAILAVSAKQVWVNVDWHDDTGIIVPVKCMLDLVPDPASQFGDSLWDLKCPNDCDPAFWAKYIYNWKLHYQGAMYLDAINAAGGFKYRTFGIVAVESEVPYEPFAEPLSEEFLAMGRIAYQSDLKRYSWCLKSKSWPSYPRSITEPANWMLKAE